MAEGKSAERAMRIFEVYTNGKQKKKTYEVHAGVPRPSEERQKPSGPWAASTRVGNSAEKQSPQTADWLKGRKVKRAKRQKAQQTGKVPEICI